MSHLQQFNDEIISSSQMAFCQLVSPPNLTTPMLKKWVKDGGQYGFFISAEQAELAGFIPDETWQPTSMGFSGKEELTIGFITQNPQLVIIHQSKTEIQHRADTSSRYRFLDLYWSNGAVTPAGELAKKNKDLYKIVTRHLALFLGLNGQPLHTEPIQYTAKGAFASSFSVELNNLYAATGESLAAYQKALGIRSPGKVLTQKARAFCVINFSINWTRNSDAQSPYCYPSQIVHPALNADEVGTTKILNRKVKDKFREVVVKKVALDKVLLDMNSHAGELVTSWYQEYQNFPKPKIYQADQAVEEVVYEPDQAVEEEIYHSSPGHEIKKNWDFDEPSVSTSLKDVPF